MDDRELEARLRTRLHERLDDATPSAALAPSVTQVFRTAPRGVGLGDLRFGRRRLSWSVVGVAGLVAIIAVAAIRLNGVTDPGSQASPDPSAPSPSVWIPAGRPFVVLPPFGSTPTKQEITRAAEVLSTRLDVLGVQGIEIAARSGIELRLPEGGPSLDSVRRVLSATGDVQFVPLPPEDYDQSGDGPLTAIVGEPLPKAEPVLFGWDGIESIEWADRSDASPTTGEPRPLLFRLNASGRAALAEYTEAHVTETMAIVIDGRVALLPTINEAISSGELEVSGGATSEQFGETTAVLLGGRLPAAWSPPSVPALVSEADVIGATLRERPDAMVESIVLDAIQEGGLWIPVWRLTLTGEFLKDCPEHPNAQDCPRASMLVSTIDASTGAGLDVTFGP